MVRTKSGFYPALAPFRGSLLALAAILLTSSSGRAATMTWDADPLTPGIQDGSGNWGDVGKWWNGSANVDWNPVVTTDTAVFGSGSGVTGNFELTNNFALIQATAYVFTNPGNYRITSDGINAGQITALANSANAGLTTANDVTVCIDVPWRLQNSGRIVPGTNSTMIFAQGNTGAQGSPWIIGAGSAVSTINATNGTWAGISGTFTVNGATLNITEAGALNIQTRFDLGRSGTGLEPSAIVNVGNGGRLDVNTGGGSDNNARIQISRGSPAELNVLPGGFVSTAGGGNDSGELGIAPRDQTANSRATLRISGGVVNVGNGAGGAPGMDSGTLRRIGFSDPSGGGSFGATTWAIGEISGGITTARGIRFGNTGVTYTGNPTNKLTLTGGQLWLGSDGIKFGVNITETNFGTNFAVTFSGGLVGAVASWSGNVPIKLDTANGDVTFQASDTNGTPYNITLAGALTGNGGLKKTGAGTLTLSGPNNYSGTTLVSEGTLAVSTDGAPTNGPVVLNAPVFPATIRAVVSTPGQKWVMGDLTFAAGALTAGFNFGSLAPSTTVAPIQINGNLAFTVTPDIDIQGSAIPTGIYPLIRYTGTFSGTVPTTIVSLPPGATSATISNDAVNKTIVLVIDATPPPFVWAVGSGIWDTTTANWKLNAAPSTYSDGGDVLLDDTASGPFPITITLNSTRTPNSVTANPTGGNKYTIAGTGSIANGALAKSGSGRLELATRNTYAGGTTLNGGVLAINNGGDAGGSAIGTGPLTILGGALDNSSGSSVTLQPTIPQTWASSFSFVGTGDLNTGDGAVTMSDSIAVTVLSNNLTVAGSITESTSAKLTKLGEGALTLSGFNAFSGGMTLIAGRLNLADGFAPGFGTFELLGGSIDNVSGMDLTVSSPTAYNWSGGFGFAGTANLDLGAAPVTLSGGGTITVNVASNTLAVGGIITGNNRVIVKEGPGTLAIYGDAPNVGHGFTVNDGILELRKNFFNSVPLLIGLGFIINTNGTVISTPGLGDNQIADAQFIIMNSGTLDLNGANEVVGALTINGGTVRNGSEFLASTLGNSFGTNVTTLVGQGFFDIPFPDAALTMTNPIAGAGALVKTGSGLLNLTATNTFTGATEIQDGTLALTIDFMSGSEGAIGTSTVIDVNAGAELDVLGRTDQTLTLLSGQVLKGGGVIDGNLVAEAGSTVNPGGSVGTLTISNNVTLNGNLLLELDRNGSPTSDRLVSASGTITYGGTLTVTNVGAALQPGDVFQLFPSAVTAFNAITLSTTDAAGYTYTWNNNVAVNGSISVASVTPPEPSINPNPGPIQVSASAGTFNLAWPTNGGWILQTNAVGLAATNQWFEYPGSTALTNLSVPITASRTNVFFRLLRP